jgi:hypothetical protein
LSPYTPEKLALSQELVFAVGVEPSVTAEQVEAFLERPVLMGGDPIFSADFGDHSGKRMTVRTCREYRAAIAAGFYAITTYDIKSEAFLKNVDSVLQTVEVARVPRLSFIEKPFRGVADFDLLPISLLPQIAPDDRELIEAMGDLSFSNLLRQHELKVRSVGSQEVSIEWGGHGTDASRIASGRLRR